MRKELAGMLEKVDNNLDSIETGLRKISTEQQTGQLIVAYWTLYDSNLYWIYFIPYYYRGFILSFTIIIILGHMCQVSLTAFDMMQYYKSNLFFIVITQKKNSSFIRSFTRLKLEKFSNWEKFKIKLTKTNSRSHHSHRGIARSLHSGQSIFIY